MEDESGSIISLSIRKQVVKDVKAFMQEKHNKDARLDVLSNLALDVRTEYRNAIEGLHPWLQLCENHWKADQLWSNVWTRWNLAGAITKGTQDATELKVLKREHSVDEGQAGPSSKRIKTMDVKKPIPSRPKPTPKVSPPFYNVHAITEHI